MRPGDLGAPMFSRIDYALACSPRDAHSRSVRWGPIKDNKNEKIKNSRNHRKELALGPQVQTLFQNITHITGNPPSRIAPIRQLRDARVHQASNKGARSLTTRNASNNSDMGPGETLIAPLSSIHCIAAESRGREGMSEMFSTEGTRSI